VTRGQLLNVTSFRRLLSPPRLAAALGTSSIPRQALIMVVAERYPWAAYSPYTVMVLLQLEEDSGLGLDLRGW
jgi:hypothetical protein